MAILKGRKAAGSKGPVNEKLSIVTLRLTGFVVDADPFKRWFDPNKLKEIDFVNDCIDAGFGLTSEMLQKVKITCPGDDGPRTIQAQSFKLSDLKLITLKKGKKVAEEPAFPAISATMLGEPSKTKTKKKGGRGKKS